MHEIKWSVINVIDIVWNPSNTMIFTRAFNVGKQRKRKIYNMQSDIESPAPLHSTGCEEFLNDFYFSEMFFITDN